MRHTNEDAARKFGHNSSSIDETNQILPGVHVARVVMEDNANLAQVRVINLGEHPVILSNDQLIGGSHTVQVTGDTMSEGDEKVLSEGLVEELMIFPMMSQEWQGSSYGNY